MKLRTRIALLGGAMIFLATLLCGAGFFRLYRTAALDRAVAEGSAAARAVYADLEAYRESFPPFLTREQAIYFFKNRRDDYCIVLGGGEVWYNQTSLDADTASNADYVYNESGAQYARIRAGDRRLLSFRLSNGAYELYRIFDVTGVYAELYRLAAAVACLSLAAAGLAALALVLVLRRALRPLTELSEGARAIAAGAYDRRVDARRSDEIGDLGRDFNRMADAVEHHIREVEESEEKKTLFMGGLTHELKTPLTAISGYAQTLRTVKLSEEDEEMALRYIHEESGRLDRLSKKMMRLLELDREGGLAFETLRVADLFAAAKRTASAFAEENGVEIGIGRAEGEIIGDRDLFTEALVNLIVNGVKASEPGSAVRLYTEDGGIVVEDSGRGIPENEIARITEPFYMVDKSRSRKSGGAGLGLALTTVILRRHSMAMRIESALGKGTKITIFTILSSPETYHSI